MGLHAVAEGVEHRHQAEALVKLGCTTVQGFLFSPARPEGELLELCGPRLFPASSWRRSTGAAVDNHRGSARRGKRGFIDEFLDQMGVTAYPAAGVAE
jgi:hypothetical protein